ncbi:MAG: 16S rRNA (guanine(527)-N(7))-methyltransferase RsmG [Prochlorococcaceae cyanobacterium]|jgi:16S rRNA (guanine527-N7)-methyltransferase
MEHTPRTPAPQSPWSAPGPPLWESLGWEPDPAQLQAFLELQEQLRHWNSRLNLTRLVEGEDFWIAQVLDSLWPFLPLLGSPAAAREPLELIDVGTGGGFPGLALAIALPAARLTLVDSVGRKVEAVRAMAEALGLAERVTLRCERIESVGREKASRGRYHWAVARAVARAPVVAEYLVPLLRPDGQALLYRGQWGPADHAELELALQPLKARCRAVHSRTLPEDRGERHAVLLEPLAPCPSLYPRPVGVPAKQPLGSPPPRR